MNDAFILLLHHHLCFFVLLLIPHHCQSILFAYTAAHGCDAPLVIARSAIAITMTSTWYAEEGDGASRSKGYGGKHRRAKGARDAHTLGKERRQQYYKNAKTIANYRKVVKEVEESEKNAEGATKRHIEKYKEVFNDSVNKEKRYHGNRSGEGEGDETGSFGPRTRRVSGKKRPNPFQRELNAKQKSEQAKLKRIEDAERQRKKAERAGKRRKRESKNHRKRTKHGQPLMKYQMGSILQKIEREYGHRRGK